MTTRIVEWKKPYTWGTAIEIDENKVISLRLRDENNLIIYDAWDNEIYVDLQLPDWIEPLDAFPVGVTTGRVLVADDWDKTGTIICAKTTSWDNIKVLYADDWTLWIDNWTWIFKQIYFKADVDLIIQAIQNQIDALSGLGKFLSLWDWETWLPISFPLSTPYEYHTWDWYMINVVDNTTNYRPDWTEFDGTASSTVETQATEIGDVYIYDWTTFLLQKNWWGWGSAVLFSQVLGSPYDNTNLATALNDKQDTLIAWTNITIDSSTNTISATAWSDIVYATQAEYTALLPWAASDGKHYFIYSTSGGWGWQPWANTIAYYTFKNTLVWEVWWTATLWSGSSIWADYATTNASNITCPLSETLNPTSDSFTFSIWCNTYQQVVAWKNPRLLEDYNVTNIFPIYLTKAGLKVLINRWADEFANYTWALNWLNTWNNIIVTYSWSGSTYYIYVNWVKYTYTNGLGFNNALDYAIFGGANPSRDYWYWYLSRFIVEKWKQRTDQECVDYYNQTKWDYWIS